MIKNLKKFGKELMKEPWVITSWIITVACLIAIIWSS
tara:strand:- start:192 stop:302 length:111 start_codon:yes stop_codon:yes gene_type:complete